MSYQVTIQKGPLDGGGLDPLGTVTVPAGQNVFYIHPYQGAHLTTIDVTGGIVLGTLTQHGTTSPDMWFDQQYNATGDGTITVNFAEDGGGGAFTVTIQKGALDGGGLDPLGTVSVPAGLNSFIIHPYAGAFLDTIDVTGGIVLGTRIQHGTTSPDMYYVQEYTVSGDGTITVNFSEEVPPGNFSLTIASTPITGIPTTLDGVSAGNTNITQAVASGNHTVSVPAVIAAGNETYNFTDWRDSTGAIIATTPSFTVSVIANTIVTATYSGGGGGGGGDFTLPLLIGAGSVLVLVLAVRKKTRKKPKKKKRR